MANSQVAERFAVARREAASAKAAKNSDGQKAAGAEIRKLKGEMAELGLSDEEALRLANSGSPVNHSESVPELAGFPLTGLSESRGERRESRGLESGDDQSEVDERPLPRNLNPETDPAYWGGIPSIPAGSSHATAHSRKGGHNPQSDAALDPDYWDGAPPLHANGSRNVSRAKYCTCVESQTLGVEPVGGGRCSSDSEEGGMGLFDEDAGGGGWAAPPPPIKHTTAAVRTAAGKAARGAVRGSCSTHTATVYQTPKPMGRHRTSPNEHMQCVHMQSRIGVHAHIKSQFM